MKLKQVLLASTICVLPFAASAADLPVKAPMRVVQPVPFTWTGFYIGGSAGFIHQDTTATDLDGMFFSAGDTIGTPSGIGGLFGVNVGYNYQLSNNIVLGIEADIAGSTLDSTSTSVTLGGSSLSVTSKLSSLGTVRGRIGYAFDHTLLYATGGFAYGHVENAINYPSDPAQGGSTSGTQTGWTVGGGLEYAVNNNWTVRVEALYVDLGTATTGLNSSGCSFGFKNRYTLSRLGLNYKF